MNRQLKPFPIATEDRAKEDWPSQVDMQMSAPNSDVRSSTRYTKSKKQRLLIVVLLIVSLILAAIGGGAVYWRYNHQTKSIVKSQAAANHSSIQATPTNNTTQTYTSNGKDLNLSFTYPTGWSVSPASGNNTSDQTITLTSTLASMTDLNNTAVTGKVVVTIRSGSASLSELSSGNATAGPASVQFAYSKPTAAQHQYPYLTFVHLPGGTNPNSGFEEVVITGIIQFAKDQPITAESLSALDPVISASFYKCNTQTCTGTGSTPLSITSTTWQNTGIFQQVQALFQSLQLN